ncbi:MAG TPA: VOC family protein [Rhodanobacteraceae bacterium]|nr:VOC family protein [Rhodanobacteraceae bacterium]
MHHSRLSSFLLDCRTDDLGEAARFWSRALGKEVVIPDDDDDGKYVQLATERDEPILLLQKVAHQSRIHLDIETDDVEAEVQRLEKLGATRVEQIHTWWVMQAPSGHRFCVIRQQRTPFGPHLNRWD